MKQYFFKKWANPGLLFVFKQTIQFLQQFNGQNVMSIQNTAQGFEPTAY